MFLHLLAFFYNVFVLLGVVANAYTDEAKMFCALNTFGVNLFSQLNRFG